VQTELTQLAAMAVRVQPHLFLAHLQPMQAAAAVELLAEEPQGRAVLVAGAMVGPLVEIIPARLELQIRAVVVAAQVTAVRLSSAAPAAPALSF